MPMIVRVETSLLRRIESTKAENRIRIPARCDLFASDHAFSLALTRSVPKQISVAGGWEGAVLKLSGTSLVWSGDASKRPAEYPFEYMTPFGCRRSSRNYMVVDLKRI